MTERWSIAPYLLVADVVATAHYYRDVLGFSFERFFGEPPAFCMVKRGGIMIMLSQIEDASLVRPNNVTGREGGAWDAYIWVGDATALHDEFVSKGATIARALCDQEYGCRDFDVLHCNGYRLCFGQDLG
ncbi:MAG TPA: VOC family protein [Thermoanaerobaculia bacterium]|jgi:predicted enzyme related to lactoylglutathione lyase|nr:VOC family protein [Thermoanaerobaculia bacterium]